MSNFVHKLATDLNPNNLRYLFYMVTPNETIYERVEDVPKFLEPSRKYIRPKTTLVMYVEVASINGRVKKLFDPPRRDALMATTWMLLLVFLEYMILDEKKYAFNDTVTSINAGILSLLLKVGGRFLSASFYPTVYDRLHIVDLPKDSASTWLLCLFTQDLVYYLGHRAVHEAGVFWSFHQMHHSSEYYNLSTALRQGAVQDVAMLFFDLLQAFAIPPNIFVVHRYMNLTYQFWLHSNAVPYLGPLEYFLNTPSSHRVHHGRNPYCIDRNYGGVLIIWDRLFGTYEPERKDEEIAYGLVTPVASFNQLWCQFFEFKAIGYDKGRMRNEKNEEIFPGVCNKIERPITRHNPPLTSALRCYLLVQWVLLISCSLEFDQLRLYLSWPEFLCRLGFLVAFLQMFGYYFDHSRFALVFDSARLMLCMLLGLLLNDSPMAVYGLISLVAVSWLASAGKISAIGKKTGKNSKLLTDLNPRNIRSILYMATPNETFYENVEDIPNYFRSPATSWMLTIIVLEFVLLDKKKREFNDTITSINAGILYLLLQVGGRFLSVSFYPMVYERLHVIELPKNTLSTWILCIFTQDFAYYLGHRAVHEAGVFWSFHQMHHSSEYFNFSTALRQGAIEYVPYLGPLEYFLNTPSSHRVHHGRNPYCIDRNYGGVLIIWDRLFGTYAPERKDEEIAYGLVKPVASFNQIWCQFFPFKAIGYDKGQMRSEKNEEIFPGVRNKIKAALWPPAYFPGMRTKPFFLWLCMEDNTEGNPEIKHPVIRYNPPLSMTIRCYLFVQWALLFSCLIQYDELRPYLSWPAFLCRLGFLIAMVQMFGYYFDNSRFALVFDSTRLMLSILLGVLLNDSWMAIYGVVSLVAVSWLAATGKVTVTGMKTAKSSDVVVVVGSGCLPSVHGPARMSKRSTFFWNAILCAAVPQLFLVALLVAYLIVGAVVFQSTDEKLAKCSFLDVILFEFGTLTTIGRLSSLIYLTSFPTRANSHAIPVARSKLSTDGNMPLPVILLLFAGTFYFGSKFVHHTGVRHSVDDVYFSFISFTTVGFGDTLPVTDSIGRLCFMLLYLTWGIMLTTALFGVLNQYLRKVHYLGRRFTGARDVPVWMGGQCITVSQLLQIVANEFDASPREVRSMLQDLDEIITSATVEKSESVPLVTEIEDFDVYE
ncbi:hypothetical protein GCK32_000331 [Trichostrongylus colubriformis]|uniref:Fatty acid hydroxylase domain-containing protein n=1 Tax=Trichostrongylus colubriformis TaxID=6319 RepID=A0AAN8FM84_TRICO